MLVQNYASLPAVFVSPDNLQYSDQPTDSRSNGVAEKPNKQKRKALIVDDVEDVTEMLSVLLTHANFDVATSQSAAGALALARQKHYDVVISDIGMPEMNGYQLVEMLRKMPGYDTVPIIALTGYSMFNDREKSESAGFTAHMTKPIDPRALLELIDQL